MSRLKTVILELVPDEGCPCPNCKHPLYQVYEDGKELRGVEGVLMVCQHCRANSGIYLQRVPNASDTEIR